MIRIVALILFGVFALIGVVASGMWVWKAYVQWQPEELTSVFEEIFDEYKIIRLTYSSPGSLGGPSRAPHTGITGARCNNVVSVLPTSVDSERAGDVRFRVFRAPCAAFSDLSLSPKVSRMSDQKIKITVSINNSAKAGETLMMRKTDASGRFRIEFEAHE